MTRYALRATTAALAAIVLLVTSSGAGATTTDADGDSIPVRFDPDSDTTYYASAVRSLDVDASYSVLAPEDSHTVRAEVEGSIQSVAGHPYGVLVVRGEHDNGYVAHARLALVLGGGAIASADSAVYLVPAFQLCYDAGNFIPLSFCHDRYLIGRDATNEDFRVSAGSGDNVEPHATGEWEGGTFDLQIG